jgi:hypothetical protein
MLENEKGSGQFGFVLTGTRPEMDCVDVEGGEQWSLTNMKIGHDGAWPSEDEERPRPFDFAQGRRWHYNSERTRHIVPWLHRKTAGNCGRAIAVERSYSEGLCHLESLDLMRIY